jgi:hypothetical protein
MYVKRYKREGTRQERRSRPSYEQAMSSTTSITSTHLPSGQRPAKLVFPEVAADWKDREPASHPGTDAASTKFLVFWGARASFAMAAYRFHDGRDPCYPLRWSLLELTSLSPFINSVGPGLHEPLHDSLSARVRCQLRSQFGAAGVHTRTDNSCIEGHGLTSAENVRGQHSQC